jgi:hypothetical protein
MDPDVKSWYIKTRKHIMDEMRFANEPFPSELPTLAQPTSVET